MKFLVPVFLAASLSLAQQSQTTSRTYDINGLGVDVTSFVNRSPGSVERIETVRNLNGRRVPVESVEDKVVSESGGVKIIERLVKRYGADGRPGPPEKVHIEERKNADGSVNTATSVMRADINSTYVVAERSLTESKKSGDTTTASTVIQRPTLNGSLEIVEKKELVKRESPGGSESQNLTVLQRGINGRFGETAKQVLEKTVADGRTVENIAVYEATNGQMQLVRQTVSREVTGSNQKEVDVFEVGQAGREGGSRPQLREQRLVEKTPAANGTVERISIRRPLDSDPNRLGNAQNVGEVICTGTCK